MGYVRFFTVVNRFYAVVLVFFCLFVNLKSVMSRRNATSNARNVESRESGSSSSTPDDFLGVDLRILALEENNNNSESSGSSAPSESSAPSASSDEPQPTPKRTRKQSIPKRRVAPVLREIRQLQKTVNLLIPRRPFQRLVREVMQKFKHDFRIQGMALEALQESSEQFVTNMFTDACLSALHAKRVTVMPKDIELVKILNPITVYYPK